VVEAKEARTVVVEVTNLKKTNMMIEFHAHIVEENLQK
jgi:hypothetical protein